MGFTEIEWPGPRPLTPDDRLFGRSRELRELVDRCATYDVILVTARSGVGKTSFVEAGGRRRLQDAGYVIPPRRPWRPLLDAPSVQAARSGTPEVHAAALYRELVGAPPRGPGSDEPGDLADAISDLAGGRPMAVVLDQTEELLRFNPALGAALLRLAGEAARDARIPHIVIARAEYLDHLRAIEVRRAKVWNLYLDEVTSDRALGEIITGPAEAEGIDVRIAPNAAARILDWWKTARRDAASEHEAGSELFGGVGLLHLQALLWSLGVWGRYAGLTNELRDDHLDAFVAGRAAQRGFAVSDQARVGRSLVEDAVTAYVAAAVRGAVEIAASAAKDRPALAWSNGPAVALARVASVLSSGGYKVPQTFISLIPVCYGEELTPRGAQVFANAVADGTPLKDFDPRRVTGAGIAVGWPHDLVLKELRDALRFVLRAMSAEQTNVLREFDISDQPVYELVHDGFGPALNKWAEAFKQSPIATLAVIAAKPGGAVWSSLDPDVFAPDGDVDPSWGVVSVEEHRGRRVAAVRNLRWNSNFIGPEAGGPRSTFRDIVFRDCDFTGAAFVACDFIDVRFEDCTFQGTVMIACGFGGTEGVRFTADDGAGALLDLLTIKRPLPDAKVTFDGLGPTTGLFLQALRGGRWAFEGCRVTHVDVSARAPTDLVIRGGRLSHLTVAGPVATDADSGAILRFAELPDEEDAEDAQRGS